MYGPGRTLIYVLILGLTARRRLQGWRIWCIWCCRVQIGRNSPFAPGVEHRTVSNVGDRTGLRGAIWMRKYQIGNAVVDRNVGDRTGTEKAQRSGTRIFHKSPDRQVIARTLLSKGNSFWKVASFSHQLETLPNMR